MAEGELVLSSCSQHAISGHLAIGELQGRVAKKTVRHARTILWSRERSENWALRCALCVVDSRDGYQSLWLWLCRGQFKVLAELTAVENKATESNCNHFRRHQYS